MNFSSRRWICASAFLAATATAASAQNAGDSNSPNSAEYKSLEVFPKTVALTGSDDAAQLVVTAVRKDGSYQDVTASVQYSTPTGKILKISATGRVSPQTDGTTEIEARWGDKTVRIPARSEAQGTNLPINFGNQVVPVLTKLGCNSGGCHGKASGQNGFKLSLLGYEPENDYAALVKDGRGRRLMPTAPDQSLLLLKGTGAVAHGGGKKLEPNSDEYKLIRRWIAAGMPFGRPTDASLTGISIYPDHRVMKRQSSQQFSVYAHYTDGRVEDITRRAQYESNDQEIAIVDGEGMVRTLSLSGEAAVMARYQGFVSTFRATVPLGVKTPEVEFVGRTLVDGFTSKKWRELGLVPSELCTDEQFVRRVHLDITGTLPTPAAIAKFLANRDPDKRDRLIDELLDSPEYAYYFANKWADILRVKRGKEGNTEARSAGTFTFHDWIREAVAADKPYDEFVSDILGASGDEAKNPPVVWYKDLKQPEQFVDDTAQVFLGLRIACAQCHHHPYEKWSQDDYWSFAAFFGKLGKKAIYQPGRENSQNSEVVYTKFSGGVTNRRTGQPAQLKPLDGDALSVAPSDDPRRKLIDWMVDPKNPYFARAVANRYFAHFMGRGIVDPIDDMRVTNPPTNPELLDALAKYFVDSKFSLKELIRVICRSRTYQLSSLPNEFNRNDKQAYSRHYPKRLAAEVLMDAVCQATNSPTNFGGLPQDRFAPNRAIMLPDESYQSYFLDVFGRPQRISACECERTTDANLAQALHLLNSEEIQNKLSRPGSRAAELASPRDTRPDEAKLTDLFLWTLGRQPTDADLKAGLAHLAKAEASYRAVVEDLFQSKLGRPPTTDEMAVALKRIPNDGRVKQAAYENILWALLNTKEFIFNW